MPEPYVMDAPEAAKRMLDVAIQIMETWAVSPTGAYDILIAYLEEKRGLAREMFDAKIVSEEPR